MTGHTAPPRDAGPAAILAARLARAYPTLPAHCAARLAEAFVRVANSQHTHAERECSEQRYDADRASKRIAKRIGNLLHWLHEWADLAKAVSTTHITVVRENDPRGFCLLIRLPGDSEPVGVA